MIIKIEIQLVHLQRFLCFQRRTKLIYGYSLFGTVVDFKQSSFTEKIGVRALSRIHSIEDIIACHKKA